MTNIFPAHQFNKEEINNLASLMSSSMLIVPGALLGFMFGTIAFLPMSAVTGLTVLGGFFSYLSAHSYIHNEAPEEESVEKKNEKEALLSTATSFRIFIGAILGISFGEIFLFKLLPGIWPNLEAFVGLLLGVTSPFIMDFFSPPDDISYNYCVKLSVAFEIMLYTGLFCFCLLESFPGWLSFYGWGAGLVLGWLGGLGVGGLVSNSISEGNKDMFAKQSLFNVSIPSIIIGLASGVAANIFFEISSIYFTLGVGFLVTSLIMAATYSIVKYFGDCNDPYSKEIVHNILILTATFFPYTFAGTLLSVGIYSFLHIYTDGLLMAAAGGYIGGASVSILMFGWNMYDLLTKNFEVEKKAVVNTNIEDDISDTSSESSDLSTISYDIVPNNSPVDLDLIPEEKSFFTRLLGSELVLSEIGSTITMLATMAVYSASNYFCQANNDPANVTVI